MKRIRMMAPFESFQGNLGSKQDLRYAEHDNKAYEAPANKRSYARNYESRFVAARVARTGLNYFMIKTKSAVKNTVKSLKQWALMGAMSIIYAVLLLDSEKLAQAQHQYEVATKLGYDGTFHKWACAAIRKCLDEGAAVIAIVGSTATITIGNNPFSTADVAIAFPTDKLVKFWKQLTENGILFSIAGDKGIAVVGMTFEQLIEKVRLNVLEVSEGEVGSTYYVRCGDGYVVDGDGNFVETSAIIVDGATYTITDESPQA